MRTAIACKSSGHKLVDIGPVIRDIRKAMNLKNLREAGRETLSKLYDYLSKHREHMDHARL